MSSILQTLYHALPSFSWFSSSQLPDTATTQVLVSAEKALTHSSNLQDSVLSGKKIYSSPEKFLYKIVTKILNINNEQRLDLNNQTDLTEEQVIQQLSTRTDWVSIGLAGVAITDKTLQLLATFPELKHLDLSRCMLLTSNGFEDLANAQFKLSSLCISSVPLQDGDLAYSLLENLTTLVATDCPGLGAVTLNRLAEIRKLTTFVSRIFANTSSEFDETLDQALSNFLSTCPLITLNISSWPLSANNLSVLQNSKTLKNLYLYLSDFKLIKDIGNLLMTLDLKFFRSNCCGTDQQTIDFLKKNYNLKELILYNDNFFSDETYAQLLNNKKLTKIKFISANKTPEDFFENACSQLPNLKSFSLSYLSASPLPLRFSFSMLEKLKTFFISFVSLQLIDDTIPNTPLDLKKITWYPSPPYMDYTLLTNFFSACTQLENFSFFLETLDQTSSFPFTQLKTLRLIPPTNENYVSVPPSYLTFLEKNPELVAIDLNTIVVTDDYLKLLNSLEKLQKIMLWFDPTQALTCPLDHLITLKDLHLCNISQNQSNYLETLVKNNALIELFIQGMQKCDVDVSLSSETIKNAIIANPCQEILKFLYVALTKNDLLEILEVCSTRSLNHVYLGGCPLITQEDVDQAIQHYPHLVIEYAR